MGRTYKQLSLDDRCEIARLSANGGSVGQIAAALDRPPSTISRELRRNRGRQVGYKPSYAQQQTRARRWKGSRLEWDASLRREVLAGLSRGWSPEQVAGRLARERGRRVISCESIYRFIYAQITRTTDFTWRRYLPRGKSKRGHRGKRGGSPASFIEGRVSLAERPAEVADRKVPGHWEADLMMFSKYRQAILAVHQRTSRLLLAVPIERKFAAGIASHLVRLFKAVPEALRRTVRQRHRVRRPPFLAEPLDEDLLLRPARAVAKGRHRERHRPLAPLHPPKDRPRKAPNQALPSVHCRLQQHPAQMP
ncbi:IS30 family transposase [Bradyrhizobium sp. USDA 3686]|uniref:IS30 family transposase n=2 Tax=Bradyrhizobium TaxID=374 RepID=UPI001956F0F6|nr:IS30 family transposase [Bradyrhizobium canariense]MBM7486911.1 IS30 family transposase [Bradyrhizobium canariense]UFW72206.1 IS30 family transposase [Bradyrhizobium canariense]